ncbi:cytochrome P450 [Melanogaster broomeanus]|nr:cytochrome P450 [Melanogaster broomeanus]
MSFLILAAILTIITSLYFPLFGRSSRFPPHVPSLIPWLGCGLWYVLDPCAFLAGCQQRYGSAFMVLVGGREVVVVSSAEATSSILLADSRSLSHDLIHDETFHVVTGVTTNSGTLRKILNQRLYPLVDKSLSRNYLGQTIQPFGWALFSHIKKFMKTQDARAVSLIQLTQEPLYNATNIALFGSSFPVDTYNDFHTLNKSVPHRLSRLPFWSWPSTSARQRLLALMVDYLQRGGVAECDGRFASGFMEALKENDIPVLDGARIALSFIWGMHSNTLNTSFWLVAFLLADPKALARVRAEIDSAIEGKFTNMETLLGADPDELDNQCFALLTSAIMETMRLTAPHAAVRLAECDLALKDGDRTIPIRKGEYVFGNVRAIHMDEEKYPDAHKFVVGRFAESPYQKGQLQTEGKPFFSLGGGRHICKGRWLAIYEIKVTVIILFRLFEISPPGEKSSGWHLPAAHRRCIGFLHPKDEVFVQVHPR